MNKEFSDIFEEQYLQYFIESFYKYADGSGYTSDLFDDCSVHTIVEGMKCENFYCDNSHDQNGLVGSRGGLTTTDRGLCAIDIMAAAYKAINAVISQLKQCFADNEEAKAEIANLLNKVLEDCIVFRNVSRNVRILFYKLDEPLDALRDAWESRVCDIQKTIDMESDAWNSSKEELFYAFRVIGYMVQGYLRKVKRKVRATIY